MKLQKMIDNIVSSFKPPMSLSLDQLYTECTASSKDAPIFFRAFGELLVAGRLEKIADESYRLKQ